LNKPWLLSAKVIAVLVRASICLDGHVRRQ
jgi:hypothetical protein